MCPVWIFNGSGKAEILFLNYTGIYLSFFSNNNKPSPTSNPMETAIFRSAQAQDFLKKNEPKGLSSSPYSTQRPCIPMLTNVHRSHEFPRRFKFSDVIIIYTQGFSCADGIEKKIKNNLIVHLNTDFSTYLL